MSYVGLWEPLYSSWISSCSSWTLWSAKALGQWWWDMPKIPTVWSWLKKSRRRRRSAGSFLSWLRGANMREKQIGLEKIFYVLRGNYWQETLLKLTRWHTASVCRPRPVKKNGNNYKQKDEDLFGVLMLLFYFYTGVYGGDHDEPTVAYCAIISEWNATEILNVYNDIMITKHFQLFAEIPF